MTVYLHRHSAHRSVDLSPGLALVFRVWLWLTTGMITKEWTAVQRKHRATTETEDDPHSPLVHGLRDINAILASSPVLKTIYEKRLELNEVWAKRGGNGEDLLKAFGDWCTSAEATGIQALHDFVRELKSYSIPLKAAPA